MLFGCTVKLFVASLPFVMLHLNYMTSAITQIKISSLSLGNMFPSKSGRDNKTLLQHRITNNAHIYIIRHTNELCLCPK